MGIVSEDRTPGVDVPVADLWDRSVDGKALNRGPGIGGGRRGADREVGFLQEEEKGGSS